jgi:hypothetical protein
MVACRMRLLHNLHVFAVPFEERRVRVPERVATEMADYSDFLGRRFQVRLIERTSVIRDR